MQKLAATKIAKKIELFLSQTKLTSFEKDRGNNEIKAVNVTF